MKKSYLLLALSFSLWSCGNHQSNEIKPLPSEENQSQTLYGGKSVEELPDFVFSLYDRINFRHLCQATRITKDYLLTSAHCFFNGYRNEVEVGNTSLISLRGKEPALYRNVVKGVTLHPGFAEKQRTISELLAKKEADPSFRIPGGGYALINPFDLALIQVDPTQLPPVKEYPQLYRGSSFFPLFDPTKRVDEISVFSHFEHIAKMGGIESITLQKRMMSFRVPGDVTITKYQGREWLSFSFSRLPDQHICMGDSGSGAFIKNVTTNHKITLVGVNSSGHPINGDYSYICMERVSFAPISAENTLWIESIINKK